MDPGRHEEGNDWQYGLFGCFGDCRLCLITFLVPCYTIGKNAEALDGDGCALICFLTFAGLIYEPTLRWRVRQVKKIRGSMLVDVIVASFCTYCTMIQEARELGWMNGGDHEPLQTEGMDRT